MNHVTVPEVLTVNLLTKTTFYKLTVPPGTRQFFLQVRDRGAVTVKVRLSRQWSAPYWSVEGEDPPIHFHDLAIGPEGLELIVESDSTGVVLECLAWK